MAKATKHHGKDPYFSESEEDMYSEYEPSVNGSENKYRDKDEWNSEGPERFIHVAGSVKRGALFPNHMPAQVFSSGYESVIASKMDVIYGKGRNAAGEFQVSPAAAKKEYEWCFSPRNNSSEKICGELFDEKLGSHDMRNETRTSYRSLEDYRYKNLVKQRVLQVDAPPPCKAKYITPTKPGLRPDQPRYFA